MLTEDLARTGAWLFRWRSYLPLGLIFLALPAFSDAAGKGRLPASPTFWDWLALAVALLGLGVRILTVGHVPAGTSGRNTLKQVATILNVTGMYSIVRHPLYLGNFLIWLGLSLIPRSWWLTVILSLIFWLSYERIIMAEERFLEEQFGELFRRWASQTPAFLPRFRHWVRPVLPFSFKAALAREYSSFFAVIAVFTALQMGKTWFAAGTPVPDVGTRTLFFCGLGTYLLIRYLKKNTTCLRSEGR